MSIMNTMQTILMVWAVIVANGGSQAYAASQGQVLFDASFYGKKAEIRRHTVDNCTDVNRPIGDHNSTPLRVAAQQNQTKVVMLLLSCDADPNFQNSNGFTALMTASERGHVDVVHVLLGGHADPNLQSQDGQTALQIASGSNHLDIVKLLILAGANVDLQRTDGWTSLMYAATRGHFEVAKELLKGGANTTIKNKYGHNAEDIARRGNVVDILTLLQQKTYKITTEKTIEQPTETNIIGTISAEMTDIETTTTTTALTYDMLLYILYFLCAIVIILVVVITFVCLYYKNKLRNKPPLGVSSVTFTNDKRKQSVHIYDN